MADDMGFSDIGCYGSEIATPNLDRLARGGLRFTHFYNAARCCPTRSALLTGLYGTEVGITDYLTPDEGAAGIGLPESALTWPRVLQQNGYRTALFGKYHLGTAAEFHPTRRGFDYFMGSLQGSFAPMNPRLEVSGRMTEIKGAGSDVVMDDAIRWIEASRKEPFAALIHFREPHLPYTPMPEEDARLFKDLDPTIPDAPGLDRAQVKQFYRDYYAAIHAVDRNIGKLLALLQRLDLDRRTIVIFQSDHGYNIGQHGIHTKGNGYWIAGGVNGPKRPNLWDTSLRIPLIAEREPLSQFYVADGITGVLIPQSDAPETAALVATFLAKGDQRAAMGNAARARVAREFAESGGGQSRIRGFGHLRLVARKAC